MFRLRLLTALSLGFFVSCAPPDTALRVNIEVKGQGTAMVRADCLRIAVLDSAGAELKSLVIGRPADDTAVVAVRRGSDLPATIGLQVKGLLGTNCADEASLKLNTQSRVETANFPESGFAEVTILVGPPDSSLDSDRDGFASVAKGGVDCDDANASIAPGTMQVCAMQVDTNCNGLVGCDDAECTSAQVCANPPTRLVLLSGPGEPREMQRHDCYGPFKFQLQNAAGVRTAIRHTPVTLSTGLADVTLHDASNCQSTAVTTYPIAYGASDMELWLKAGPTARGTANVTAAAYLVPTPAEFSVKVKATPATKLVITSAPVMATAGVCSTQTIDFELQDDQSRHTDADDGIITVTLSTPGIANLLFSDASCGNGAAGIAFQPGTGNASVHVRNTLAGVYTLFASGSAPAPLNVSQPVTVLPAAPHHLDVVRGSLALSPAEVCSSDGVGVALEDAFNNRTAPPAGTTLTVVPTMLPGVSFFDDNNCTAAASTTVSFPSASATRLIRARGTTTTTGSLIVTTNLPNVTPSPPLVVTVGAGPADHLDFSGVGQQIVAGHCSSTPFLLQVRDSANNGTRVDDAGINVTFSAVGASPDLRFFDEPNCPDAGSSSIFIGGGRSSANVYFRGTTAKPAFEVTASSPLPVDGGVPGNTIIADVPSQLLFTGISSATTQAMICTATPFTATVRDRYGNDALFPNPQTLTFTSTPVGATVGVGGVCGGSQVLLAANTSAVNFNATARQTDGGMSGAPYALNASIQGVLAATTSPVRLSVTPANPELAILSPANLTQVSAGDCQNITVVRRDQYDNPAPVSMLTVLGVTAPDGTPVFAAQNCTGAVDAGVSLNNGAFLASFSVRPRLATQQPIAVTNGAENTSVTLDVRPGAPTLVFEVPATDAGTASVAPTAGDCVPVRVVRKDSSGNPVPVGTPSTLTFNPILETTVYNSAGCMTGQVTDVALNATQSGASLWVKPIRTYTTGSNGGSRQQSATFSLAGQNATLTMTVSPDVDTTNLIIASPDAGIADVTAGACLPVTLERRDRFQNLVALGTAGTVSVMPPTSITAYSSTMCVGGNTINVGATAPSHTFGVRTTTAGNQGAVLGLGAHIAALQLNVSPGPLFKFIFEGTVPTTLTAGTCSDGTGVLLRRQDEWNNNVISGSTMVSVTSNLVSFAVASGCAGPTPSTSFTIGEGASVSSAPFFFTGTSADGGSIEATAMVSSNSISSSHMLTVTPSTPTKLAFTNTTPTTTAAGACVTPANALRVELQDTFNNRVAPGNNVNVAFVTDGGVQFSQGTACGADNTFVTLTSAAPTASFVFTTNRANPALNIGVSTSDLPNIAPATQVWAVTPLTASVLAWKTDPTASVPRFTCTPAGQFETRDSLGNLVAPNTTVTVTPTASPASGVAFYSDAACATPVSTVQIPGGSTDAPPLYVIATSNGTIALSATATGFSNVPRNVNVTGAQGTFNVTPAATVDVEAGACVPLTIERRANGTPLTVGVTSYTVTASNAAAISVHSLSDCSGAAAATVSGVITQPASTAVVYVRGRSSDNAADSTVTVADPTNGSTSTVVNLRSYPLVRRGACNIASGSTASGRCVLPTAIPGNVIARSFLLFSSTGGDNTASNTNARCVLDVASDVAVVCTRGGNGAVEVRVNYQVVSFGRSFAQGGVSVAHLAGTTSNAMGTTDVGLGVAGPVSFNESFVLLSSSGVGGENGADDFMTAYLYDTTTVRLQLATAALRDYAVQVVQFAGASVERNELLMNMGELTKAVTSLPAADLSRSFLLYSTRGGDGADLFAMCKRRARGSVSSTTALAFSRGGGAGAPAVCDDDPVAIRWERVRLPCPVGACASVQHLPSFPLTGTNLAAVTPTFTAITQNRAVVFMGGQGPGGQSSGESSFNRVDGDTTGPFHGRVWFSANDALTIERSVDAPTDGGVQNSVWSPMVVQFEP